MNAVIKKENPQEIQQVQESPSGKLDIWTEAFNTPPEFTKSYSGAGGFSGKAITSMYPVFKATEIFGPVGKGWGYEIVKDEFLQGGPLVDKEGQSLGCNEQTHSLTVELWAMKDGVKMKATSIGLTPHITKNKWGVLTDHEAQKKSLTDAIKGGLKMWGISADVYMGQHDDPNYVKAMSDKSEMDKADDKASVAIKQTKEYEDWKATNLSLVQSAVSLNELVAVHKAAVIKATHKNDKKYIDEITKACAKRKEFFAPTEESA